jgi:Mg2+/Co2+ transporter CorB
LRSGAPGSVNENPLSLVTRWSTSGWLTVGVLIALSALFSATQSALRTLDRNRLRQQVLLGNRSARLTETLLGEPERLFGTILVCRTAVHVMAICVASNNAALLAGGWGVALLAVLMTLVLMVLSELAPRRWGAHYAEQLALPSAWMYVVLVRLAYPLVWTAETVAEALLRVLRVPSRPPRRSEHMAAARPLVDSSDERADHLLATLQDLETVMVEDIMIPRSDIASIDIADDWDSILNVLRTTPHTRLPVCEQNLDNIIGILHMKKIAHAMVHGEVSRETLLLLAREREAYFVPKGTTLATQLQNFQRNRRRIALVVDEYGDIQGLVTLEDILEEIVGEFTSDPATLNKDIHREADGAYVINGAISVRVLNRALGWLLPTDGPRTLNGVILEYLETIPEPGTSLKLGNLSVEILQTADNAVKTARLKPLAADNVQLSKGVA